MRDIRASAEVVALIGTESLRELEKDAFRSYECAECGSSGLTTDATSVVVHRYRGTAMVRLTRYPTRNSRSAACIRCSTRRLRPAHWPAVSSPVRTANSPAQVRARHRRSWPVRSAASGAPRSQDERQWPHGFLPSPASSAGTTQEPLRRPRQVAAAALSGRRPRGGPWPGSGRTAAGSAAPRGCRPPGAG